MTPISIIAHEDNGVLYFTVTVRTTVSLELAKSIVETIFVQLTNGIGHVIREHVEVAPFPDFDTKITTFQSYARFSISKDWPKDMSRDTDPLQSAPLGFAK